MEQTIGRHVGSSQKGQSNNQEETILMIEMLFPLDSVHLTGKVNFMLDLWE